MKLVDWKNKERIEFYVGSGRLVDGPKLDSLHVIGTCGECEYWGDHDMAWDEDARPYRLCWNENISVYSPMQRRSNPFLKDFGCIHFEAKGEK